MGVLIGGRGNAVAARSGSGAYIVPLLRGSCNTMTGTARQRGTQDAQKFPGHRWSGLLRKTSHNKRFETRGLQKARNRWDDLVGRLRMMVDEIYCLLTGG